jgi:hypothetical protein
MRRWCTGSTAPIPRGWRRFDSDLSASHKARAVTLSMGILIGAVAGFVLGWAACVVLAWAMCRAAARGDDRIRREPFVPSAERLQREDDQ